MDRRIVAAAAVALFAVVAGCGGGTKSSSPATPPGQSGTISGTVVKGAVNGATVAAFAIADGTMGAQIGTATTDATGHFSMPIGDHAGPIMLRASGGAYADEATGATMTMQPADVMTAAMPSMTAGAAVSGVVVTPLTSMAQARAQQLPGGMTPANMTAANASVGSYFMVGDILMTPPMDPNVAGAGASATQDARNYGMSIAAICEYAQTEGMTLSSSGMVTAMMEDASDGVMNGMMGSTSVSMAGMTGGGGMMGGGTMAMPSSAGTTGLASAMSAFVGSAMNRSGVTAAQMQPLVQKLQTSSGALP